MARIKKYSPEQKLSSFQTLVVDENTNSDYFRITEFNDTFTGGKNGFLIEGSEYLKETTEIKIEITDVAGNPIYYEPGKGIPEYYEGISSLIAVYIYNDTPIGLGKITVLGELKEYNDNGVKRVVPDEWKGTYNLKWERTFQVNKILANEDRVRFLKRPQINIDEINKPIFNNNANLITQIGNVNGIPLAPTAGTKLTEFSLPTSYRLNVSNGSNWTGSIDGNSIKFDNIDYNPTVLDVVSETEVIVSPPYAPNGIVAPFSNESYTTSFNYIEGVADLATALTGSFAKIIITDMKTVVGDAARVKVYRRSQSNLTDYEFVQEIQLESNELLRDIETTEANEITYGTFTEDIINQYWLTSSNDISVELNTGFLYNSAKLNSTEGNHFLTAQSFPIQKGVEYTLDFNVKKGSDSPTDFLKVTLSGSLDGTPKSQTIVNIPASNTILQKRNFSENIIADDFDEAQLYFEVDGVDWYVNNVSLKASQETSFSPDEITFIQQVPKTLQTETFDYRFEFYDINNNYIPVLVEDTKTFNGGNLNLFNKDITLTPNNLYFSFDSASAPANPLPPTTITFDVETTLVTGSVTYTSGAYDEFGDILLSSQYAGGQYPGLMSGYETLSPTLTVADFTGSRDDITVQYIRFTGEVEGVSDDVVITRSQDGKGGVNFEIRPYRGTIIKNKGEETLELQAIRIDGINEIILRDNLVQTGFSDAKLRVQSGSDYILLSDAQSSGFIEGLTAGTTGSGELDYNAVFDRTSITGQLPLYLMDGTTKEDILTTLLLTDLQDGLGAGFTTFDVEQFNINPKEDTTFTPQTASLAGNFYLRGTNESPISGTLKVFPSMSIDESLLPEYYMFFETGAFDSRITVTATNAQNEIIGSGIPGDSVEYYIPIDSKQLTFNFTYVENFTSESISVDKTIFVVPDGLGIDPVVVSVDPLTLNLNSNQQGEVYSYTPLDTTITAKQGKLDLIYTGSEKPGTFYTESISTTNIEYTTESFTNTTLSLTGFDNMTSSLVASVDYNLKVYPYYTSSFQSQTITQRITKGVDGSDAVEIVIEPSVVSLQADENGTVTDYSTANTNIVVKQSNLYLSYETSSLPGTFNVSATGSGIVIGDISASSQYDLDFGDETVHFTNFSELEGGSGSVDYNFVVFPYSLTNGVAGVVETYNKKQVFSKSNDGTAARSVSLSTTTEIVNFDGDGVVTSPVGSIFLEATPFNVTGSQSYYQFFRDGFAYSLIGTDNTFEIGSGDATSPGETATWGVKLRDGNSTSAEVAEAEVTIAGIKAGADNYQVSLTNPSPSVGVTVAGTLTLDTTGTQIRAFKAATELTHVSTYSSQTLDQIGEPIGTLGEFSSSLHYIPTFITQPNIPNGNPASIDAITGWNTPQDNKSATLVYKVDIENGRATYFLSQSLSTVFEGATGPGLVMRGEWSGSAEYQFSLQRKRRDAVVVKFDNSGETETHYFATTEDIVTSSTQPYSEEPIYAITLEQGDNVSGGWEYLGQQDYFVAAKLAIFEESFVENTINVGIPPDGSPNANIAIVGGSDEPYIAIGQQGIQGFNQPGIFMGMSNDGGVDGSSTLGLLSLKSTPDPTFNSLEWDGDTLTIRGALRQTAAGIREGTLQGVWGNLPTAFQFVVNDIVTHAGRTWVCILNHTRDTSAAIPLTGGSYTTYWVLAADAGSSGTAGTAGSGGTNGTAGTGGSGGVNGTSGPPGAGVVYRGEFSTTDTYVSNDIRTDVVKYNGSYIICNTDGATGAYVPSEWDSFGAEFTSVATDILFAQDVYANRTVNIGTGVNGSPVIALNADYPTFQSPHISIGQVTESFNRTGIFLGYQSGSVDTKFSMVNPSASRYLSYDGEDFILSGDIIGSYIEGSELVGGSINVPVSGTGSRFSVDAEGNMSASNANMSGVINANSGRIGEWIIDEDTQVLRDEDTRIVFEPNIPEIQLFDTAGSKKVIIGPQTTLSDVASSNVTISWGTADALPASSIEITTGQNLNLIYGLSIGATADSDDVTPTANGILEVAAGDLELTLDYPSMTVFQPNGIVSNGTSYPNYNPSYNGQQHGSGNTFGKRVTAGLYLEVVDGQQVLGSKLLRSLSSYSDNTTGNYWVGQNVGGGGTCLVGTSLIEMGDGSFKQIKDMGVGDLVKSLNIHSLTPNPSEENDWESNDISDSTKVNEEVLDIKVIPDNEIYNINGGLIECTISHKHIINKDGIWSIKTTENLNIGDIFLNSNDEEVNITSIEKNETTEEVYNIRVSGKHTYYVNGILTHNAKIENIESVTGDTKITLSSGEVIFAENVKEGEKILAWNWNDKLDDTIVNEYGEFTIEKIQKRKVSTIYKVSAGGNTVKVSDSHGFWLNDNTQIKSTDLVAGKSMINIKDGNDIKYVLVDYIEIIETDEYVYTFEVPGVHNYISDNIISHNSGDWSYVSQSTNTYSNTAVASALTNQNTLVSINTASTNAKLRYVVKLSARSGYSISTNSSGTGTAVYYTHTAEYDITTSPSAGHLASFTPDESILVAVPSNFVEIKAGGIQVVSDPDTFVRLKRNSGGSTSEQELLRVKNGSSYFSSDHDAGYDTAIYVDGDIEPEASSVWDLGRSTRKWDNIWTNKINNAPINHQMVTMVACGVFTQSVNNASPTTSQGFNVGSVTRNSEGVYTISLASTSGFTLSQSFANIIGFGRSGDANSYNNVGDNEFTCNWAIKVNSSNIEFNSKDNNSDTDKDFYKAYFILFGK